MANPEHLAIVQQGGRALWQWRKLNRGVFMDLSDADLRETPVGESVLPATWLDGADLTGANLSGMYITSLVARNASLRGANLQAAVLWFSDMSGADLTDANLQQCYMHAVDLRSAKLIHSDLMTAALNDANVAGADFTGSLWGSTMTGRVDLSNALGLGEVEHRGSSYISTETMVWGGGIPPLAFFRRSGVPQAFLDQLPSLRQRQAYQSCMISYTETDNEFSQKLYDDLRAAGIDCWRWRERATWGEPVRDETAKAVEKYDRLVVVLSKDALKSAPVLEEIERALKKEERQLREGLTRSVLFPVRIDDAVFEWADPRRLSLTEKVMGDFSLWHDRLKFDESFARLLAGLRKNVVVLGT